MIKISIITTTCNAAATLGDCLESVREQTHGDVEHVVVDAASTDGTLDILREIKNCYHAAACRKTEGRGQRTGDRSQEAGDKKLRGHVTSTCPRFSFISEPDSGIYDGMNKGLRLVTGDVVGILNGDDFYHSPDVLAWVARVFEDEGVDSCYGDLVYVKESIQSSKASKGVKPLLIRTKIAEINRGLTPFFQVVRYWRSGEFDYKKFYWGWMPPHPTFFVRRSVYEKYGLFNLELGTAADYELMLRFLVKHRVSVAYIPEILVDMRSGGASNVTTQSRLRANRMDRKAWAVNGLKPYPWTLMMKPLRKVGQWFSKPEDLK